MSILESLIIPEPEEKARAFLTPKMSEEEALAMRYALTVYGLSLEEEEALLRSLPEEERRQLRTRLGDITALMEAAVSNDPFMNRNRFLRTERR